jgi:hypothetical protein
MKQNVVFELDKVLVDGEILIYKDNKLKSVEIHQLLPELDKFNDLQRQIDELRQTIANLAKIVKEK